VVREVKNKSKEASILTSLADAYFNQKQYERAIEFYQQALPIAREAKDKFREAKVLSAIGSVYLYQGQSKQAIQEIQDKSSQAELLIIYCRICSASFSNRPGTSRPFLSNLG
jgi:tetratricopeptide (TPR) repeat protein